jgi:hypothetical protein
MGMMPGVTRDGCAIGLAMMIGIIGQRYGEGKWAGEQKRKPVLYFAGFSDYHAAQARSTPANWLRKRPGAAENPAAYFYSAKLNREARRKHL